MLILLRLWIFGLIYCRGYFNYSNDCVPFFYYAFIRHHKRFDRDIFYKGFIKMVQIIELNLLK